MNKIRTPLSNIMEIMSIVLEKIEENGYESSANDPMVHKLLSDGFKIEDIDAALKLIAMITSKVDPLIKVGTREKTANGMAGIRHLHESETLRLAPDAQQLLLSMVEEEAISPLHFEKVLEYIWKKDLRNVSVSRLELLIILNKPEGELEEYISDSLPLSMEIH